MWGLHMSDLIDVFGAPEFLVSGIYREMICPELVRLTLYRVEDGQKIIKARVLMTASDFTKENHRLARFIGHFDPNEALM